MLNFGLVQGLFAADLGDDILSTNLPNANFIEGADRQQHRRLQVKRADGAVGVNYVALERSRTFDRVGPSWLQAQRGSGPARSPTS